MSGNSSDSDDVTSGSDSELESMAKNASNQIKSMLKKTNNKPKINSDHLSASESDVTSGSDSELESMAKNVSNQIKSMLKNTKQKGKTNVQSKLSAETPTVSVNTSIQNQSENNTGFVIDKAPMKNDADFLTFDSFPSKEKLTDKDIGKSKKKEKNNSLKDRKKLGSLSSSLQTGIKLSENYLHNTEMVKKNKSKQSSLLKSTESKKVEEIMKKSVITPDFEKQFAITPYEESIRQQKKQRKKEKEKSKGKNWFDMMAPEMTEEKKNDLMVIKMRKSLDPKRFYKNDDTVGLPKYFQFGTVVESSADFYHSRIPKKQRKSTMVEELLADAEFRKYNKRKYAEIQEKKRKAEGPYKHMKRLKRNKRR